MKKIIFLLLVVLLALGMAACGVEDVLPAEVPEADIRADVQEYLAAFVDSEAQIVSLAYTQEGTGAERQVTCEVEHTNGSITLSMRYEQEKIAWVLCGTEIIRGDETAKTPEEPGDTQKNQPGTESIVAEGKCTDTISWALSEDKVMTLSGTGSLDFWRLKNEEALPFAPEIVVIGEGITEVPTLSFEDVDSLKEFCVAEGNPAYNAVDGILYESETNTLHLCPAGYDKIVEVPEGVLEIERYAFSAIMKGIRIPASMQMIPAEVLSYFGVDTIEIEEGGIYQFEDDCLYAKTVYATGEGFELIKSYRLVIRSMTVPEGVTRIGDEAFRGCTGLTEIILPDSLTVIGDRAFAGCSSLSKVVLPDSLMVIGDGAFKDCSDLNEIAIPASVCMIGVSPFGSFGYLENKNITVASDSDFYFAENGILYEINSLDAKRYSVVICFDNSRETVELLDGTTVIKKDAFATSSEMKSIILPASLEIVESNAFHSSYLNTIYYRGTQEQWKNVCIEQDMSYSNDNKSLIDSVIYCNYTD